MRKIVLSFFFLFIQVGTVLAVPQINSEASYLINAENKQVLYEKNGNQTMYPASTTKIMTTLVALKHGDLHSIVTVSDNAAGLEGSSLNLKVGDQLTLRDLLRGMMAVSGNDAAQAVAKHVGGGSSQIFINWMNEEAAALGAMHTHFSNPHGLPDPENYTTAHDLAIITAYAYHQPGFIDYVSHKYQTIHFINRGTNEKEENINELIGVYPGCNGVKTGTTREAGECLVAAAERNGIQLIAVVLHSANRWEDATNLLDYGFQQIELLPPCDYVNKNIIQKRVTNSPKTLENVEKKSGIDFDTSKQVSTKSDSPVDSSNNNTEQLQFGGLNNLYPNQLLEFGVCGGGSSDISYLFQTDIFNGTQYIGPVVKYSSHKNSNISIGVRLAMPSLDFDNLIEFSIYGDHSLDAAYLFQTHIFNKIGYIGPVIKYDSNRAGKLTIGAHLAIPFE
jgi:serine-type D-Ala-D-Ala carboxypeptidase (penicillin-binding protein 5/6)